MKILFVCNEYPPQPHGGIGVQTQALAKALVRFGHQVVVVGCGTADAPGREEDDHGVRVVRVPPGVALPSLRAGRYRLDARVLQERVALSREVDRIAEDFRPDLVESHDWSGPLWRAPKVPFVVRMHGAHTALTRCLGRRPSWVWRFLERRNLAAADALVAVSDHIGQETIAALNLGDRRYHVIPNGVDAELFRPLDLPRRENEILYVGAIRESKGLTPLFEAAGCMLASDPRAQLSIVGRLPRGGYGSPLVQRLLARIDPVDRRRVRFVGAVEHSRLPEFYSTASVCVVPSLAEAFGVTCIEAMSCGCATIMSDRGAGAEIIEHGRNGLLVDPLHIEELGRALLALLLDPDRREKLGAAARRTVLETFAIETVARRNVAFYEEFLGSPAQAWPLQRIA